CANGTELRSKGELVMEIELDGNVFPVRFVVVVGATDAVSIGMSGIRQLGLVLDGRVRRIQTTDDADSRVRILLQSHSSLLSTSMYDVGKVGETHCIT